MKRKVFYNNKVSLLLVSLIVFSCTSTPTTYKPNKIDNPIIAKNVSNKDNNIEQVQQNIPIPAVTIDTSLKTKEDEKSITDIINSSLELFPEDSATDIDVNEATVLNSGGVVFATVLNSGGVVFATGDTSFVTKAVNEKDEKDKDDNEIPKRPILNNIQNKKDEIIENVKNKVTEIRNKKVVKLPIKWIRKIIGKPKKDIQFEFNKDKTLATVTVTRTLLIELSNTQLPSKQTNEKSVTKAIFIKNEKGWTLDKIAPPKNSSSNNESSEVKDIEIKDIKFVIHTKNKDGKIQTKNLNVSLSDFSEKEKIISIERESLVELEVTAVNKDDPEKALNVFTQFGSKDRIPLFDDGSKEKINNNYISNDKIKDDDIYTTNILIKNKQGIGYLNITAINGDSFNAGTSYSSVSKSIPINIK